MTWAPVGSFNGSNSWRVCFGELLFSQMKSEERSPTEKVLESEDEGKVRKSSLRSSQAGRPGNRDEQAVLGTA